MENNKRTEEILNSLKGMKRAEASPFLFTRIQAKLAEGASQAATVVPVKWVTLSLAGLALLFLVNVYTVKKSGTAKTENGSEAVSENYLSTQNGFYY